MRKRIAASMVVLLVLLLAATTHAQSGPATFNTLEGFTLPVNLAYEVSQERPDDVYLVTSDTITGQGANLQRHIHAVSHLGEFDTVFYKPMMGRPGMRPQTYGCLTWSQVTANVPGFGLPRVYASATDFCVGLGQFSPHRVVTFHGYTGALGGGLPASDAFTETKECSKGTNFCSRFASWDPTRYIGGRDRDMRINIRIGYDKDGTVGAEAGLNNDYIVHLNDQGFRDPIISDGRGVMPFPKGPYNCTTPRRAPFQRDLETWYRANSWSIPRDSDAHHIKPLSKCGADVAWSNGWFVYYKLHWELSAWWAHVQPITLGSVFDD